MRGSVPRAAILVVAVLTLTGCPPGGPETGPAPVAPTPTPQPPPPVTEAPPAKVTEAPPAKATEAPPPPPPPPAPVTITRWSPRLLKVGQRFRFARRGGTEEVLTVRKVSNQGSQVDYTSQTFRDGQPVEEAKLEQFWGRAILIETGLSHDELVRVGRYEFNCNVARGGRPGDKYWTHYAHGDHAFPGTLRVQDGGRVTWELIAVEDPAGSTESAPPPPPRPSWVWGPTTESEVQVRHFQRTGTTAEKESWSCDLAFLERTTTDGVRTQRHYVRGVTRWPEERKNLEGNTITILHKPGSEPPYDLGKLDFNDGISLMVVRYSFLAEDWVLREGSRGALQGEDVDRATRTCPGVIRGLAKTRSITSGFGPFRAPPTWSVDTSQAPGRRSSELVMQNDRWTDRYVVTQTSRQASRPFPERELKFSEGDLSEPAESATPEASVAAPAPVKSAFEELSIADALKKAREEGQLLAVVFSAIGEDQRYHESRVTSALQGRGVETLRAKFLFVRRPQCDDLGLPTPEAEAHRADKSPTVVLLNPWVTGGASLIATDGELNNLRGTLERGLLEAARTGHPPARR